LPAITIPCTKRSRTYEEDQTSPSLLLPCSLAPSLIPRHRQQTLSFTDGRTVI
jgi:hypothetical protein